ncbi:MAG: tetratricopeptide repeat protein [Alphaproteobacteria bacterium]
MTPTDQLTVPNRAAVAAALKEGQAHHIAGRLQEAEAIYRRVFAAEPNNPDALHLLGVIAHQVGNNELAVQLIGRAIAANPRVASYHNNLGNALHGQGRLEDAVAACHRALELEPGYAEVHYNLGNMLRDQGKLEDSVAAYHRVLELKPDYPKAHNNLGIALHEQGKLEEAGSAYHRELELKPYYPDAHNNLGSALLERGRLEEAVAAYHMALELKPDYAEAHSNLIVCMNSDERYSQQDIFAESRRWEAVHATPGTAREAGYLHDRDPERRLRIGYVSPDFKCHSVSHFLDPLIAGHDRRRFEVLCYAQVANPDDETRRFQGLADYWCSTVGMTAPTIAERVRADGIDILVDLAGHTANNRLLVFARKPAPVQVSYIGYPNTTGLSAMDYRLTDDIADPEGPGDALHSERLTRLPNGFLCFAPGVEAPAVAEPPALADGPVTFGSFNNLSKVTVATVAAWARILEGAPESRLLLKNRSLADEETRRRYRTLFAERGIDGDRLEFHAWIDSTSGHLGAYDRIDIGLDPFPYNGTTTTCEALWMGVPVISLRGDRHASRVGASILTRVGLAELIADSVDDYVTAAVALAEAPGRLVELRRDLRAAMAASPLCDAAGFIHVVEAAYREMWRRWCQVA